MREMLCQPKKRKASQEDAEKDKNLLKRSAKRIRIPKKNEPKRQFPAKPQLPKVGKKKKKKKTKSSEIPSKS